MKKSNLIIDNDLEVTIGHIDQWLTYSGMLEGIPTDRWNAKVIERTKIQAKGRFHSEAIHLIEPTQKPIEVHRKYALGKPMKLPAVTCMMNIYSSEVFRDQDKMGSSLVIIWFQDDYAFPIEAAILQKIKEIPFRKICEEFDF